jgi:hypothetical protein
MKANFKITDDKPSDADVPKKSTESSDLTEEEFETYLQKLPKGWNLWNIRSLTKD